MPSHSDHNCYKDNGKNYRGTVSKTVTGVECVAWNEQIFYKTVDYPELIGGHNYCRNPGGMDSQPWCFIKNLEMGRVLCDVPKCCELYDSLNVVFN